VSPSDPEPGTFPAVTLDDWRREAERVLKGKPLDALTWRTEDGIDLAPVAPDRTDAVTASPGRRGPVRTCATVEDPAGVDAALAAGFDRVRICYDHDEQAEALGNLPLDRVLLDPVDAVSATAALRDLPGAAGVVLGWWGWTHVAEHATPAQQIGWILSAAIDVATEADEDQVSRLVLEVPVGVEILTEVAKLRALRRVWTDVAAERELPPTLRLLATCPSFPHTRLDAESNLLRATLAGFAAVTGGADVVELAPYRDDDEAARLTLNQMHLMRDESALDVVADPLAGAGVVEQLTAELSRAGRAELDRLRGLGGFLAVERDWNEDRLEQLVEPHAEPQAARATAIARRRRGVVGINRFADPSRDADVPRTEDAEEAYGAWTEPDTSLAEWHADGVKEFEFLRERMLWHEDAGHTRPAVLLLPFGPVGWRRARADFAADLFRAAGFTIEDAGGLDSVDAAIERAAGAPVVVLCSDDASYPDAAPRVAAALPDCRVFVAGKAPDGADAWGVAGFVFQGVDAVAVLCALQDGLGIGRRP
jgi:methylmalonyl-CoA mutase